MKHFFAILVTIFSVIIIGCTKSEEGSDTNATAPVTFKLSQNSISIDASGGTASITVYSNHAWKIEGSSDWCKPSARSGGPNESGQKITFSTDESYEVREAIFHFVCNDKRIELKITQNQKNVIFPDNNNNLNIPATGGIAVIKYKTNVACKIVIPDEAKDWISLSTTRALQDESVNLNIATNETYEPRSAKIKVIAINDSKLYAEYTINQQQTDVIIAGEDNKFVVPSNGGDVSIDFTTNVSYKVNIPSSAQSWITPIESTKGVTPHSITLRVAKNTTYDKRSAIVSITKDGASTPTVEYTIEQNQNDDIILDGDTLSAPAKGGSFNFDYQSNVDCKVIIPEEFQEWISIDPQTRSLERYSVTLVIATNNSFDKREATIKVESQNISREIKVKQAGVKRVLSISPAEIDLQFDAKNISVNVDSNVDYDIVIAEDCDWITISNTENSSDSKVVFAVSENPTIYSRSTKVIFKGKGIETSLSVTQQGDKGVLMLNDEYVVKGQDTELSIEFKSNFDYRVSIPENCDWLTIPNTRAAPVSHTILFTLTPNTTFENRSVDIVVSDIKGDVSKKIKITQLRCDLSDLYQTADNEILYTSIDGKKITPTSTTFGSVNIIENTYQNGMGKITFSGNVTKLEDGVFKRCTNLKHISIPNTIKEIGESAFEYCSNLQSIKIPDGVTSIGSSAFSKCRSLTSITIPDGVTSIENSAFYGCSGLTSITIPNSVTSIDSYAFSACANITQAIIGFGITSISNYAFQNCSKLNIVYCNAPTPPTIFSGIFSGCAKDLRIYVIDESVDAYKSTWRQYASIIYAGATASDILPTIHYKTWDNKPIELNLSNVKSHTYDEDGGKITMNSRILAIPENAFLNCKTLTSITIPEGVTSIGSSAFAYCCGLTSINIPNSVTSIDLSAFDGCSNLNAFYGKYSTDDNNALVVDGTFILFSKKSGVTSYTIPNGVTSISASAFSGCSSLTSITIPDGVTSIGNSAFSGCSSLNRVWVNAPTPPTIGSGVFSGCATNLCIYVVDNSVYTYKTTWSQYASIIKTNKQPIIHYRTSDNKPIVVDFANIILSHTYDEDGGKIMVDSKTIPADAFDGCRTLTSISIPNGITSISRFAFSGCGGVTSITIPNSVTSIDAYAFSNCTSLTSITIPDGVTSIGLGTFKNCSGLTSITIPDGVTSIGNEAFRNCSGLTSITIPDGVTSIGNSAFNGCRSLNSVWVNASTPPTIGNDVFYSCADDIKIHTIDECIDAYKSTWSQYASIIYAGVIASDILPVIHYKTSDNKPIKIDFAISHTYDEDGGKIVMGSKSFTIPTDAFKGCSTLTSINIPKGATSIGDYAFYKCGLKSITIPEGVTSIGSYALSDCRGLTSITIPSSVTSMGYYAFSWCTNLTNITISKGVTSIGPGAFSNCWNLTSITIPNSVSSIGSVAFESCYGLTNITIPNSVTTIGHSAFSGCWGLTSITISEGVTSIGEYAFKGCRGLARITIPNSVTSIGDGAFAGCDKLSAFYGKYSTNNNKALIVNRTLVSLAAKSGLTSFTIPENVIFIGASAFSGCSSLTKITSKSTIPPIIKGSLDLPSKIKLYVPAGYGNAYYSSDWRKYFSSIDSL